MSLISHGQHDYKSFEGSLYTQSHSTIVKHLHENTEGLNFSDVNHRRSLLELQKYILYTVHVYNIGSLMPFGGFVQSIVY
jgi:hypothetical protein